MANNKKRRRGRNGRAVSQGRPGERRGCSRKRRHHSKIDAQLGQAHIANRWGYATRIYRCRYCNGWHLAGNEPT